MKQVTSENLVIKELEKELKRLRLNNLRLKIHMDVLIRTPRCEMANILRKDYSGATPLSDSIFYLN